VRTLYRPPPPGRWKNKALNRKPRQRGAFLLPAGRRNPGQRKKPGSECDFLEPADAASDKPERNCTLTPVLWSCPPALSLQWGRGRGAAWSGCGPPPESPGTGAANDARDRSAPAFLVEQWPRVVALP